jgi:hypothetical protein
VRLLLVLGVRCEVGAWGAGRGFSTLVPGTRVRASAVRLFAVLFFLHLPVHFFFVAAPAVHFWPRITFLPTLF